MPRNRDLFIVPRVVPTVDRSRVVKEARLTDEGLLDQVTIDRWKGFDSGIGRCRILVRLHPHVRAYDIPHQVCLGRFGFMPTLRSVPVDYGQQYIALFEPDCLSCGRIWCSFHGGW